MTSAPSAVRARGPRWGTRLPPTPPIGGGAGSSGRPFGVRSAHPGRELLFHHLDEQMRPTATLIASSPSRELLATSVSGSRSSPDSSGSCGASSRLRGGEQVRSPRPRWWFSSVVRVWRNARHLPAGRSQPADRYLTSTAPHYLRPPEPLHLLPRHLTGHRNRGQWTTSAGCRLPSSYG